MAIPDYTKTELNISFEKLNELPDDLHLYTNLQELDCRNNHLTQLDNLPQSLIELDCSYNKLIQLDNLPQSLKELDCNENPLEYYFNPTLANIRKHNATSQIATSK